MDGTLSDQAGSAPEFSRLVKHTDIGREDTITVKATPDECAALAQRFGLEALSGLVLKASLTKWRSGVKVSGHLTAEAVQRSVATLEPVTQRIDERFERGFLRDAPRFDDVKPGAEVEMPLDPELDDAPEPLGDRIDIGELAAEALGLALDPWPRAGDEEFLEAAAGPPGQKPMTDEDAKPFASLAAYREKLAGDDGTS